MALIQHATHQGWIEDAVNFMEALDPLGRRGINYLQDPSTGIRWPHLSIGAWHVIPANAAFKGEPVIGKDITQFAALHPDAKPPSKAHQEDVGYDLCSLWDQVIGPGHSHLL